MKLNNYLELTNEDNMEIMKRFDDNHFDLAIVDPPYGIGPYWMKQIHTQHYGNKQWNEQPPTEEYFIELFRVSKNQIIWGGNYFSKSLPETNSWIFWDKGSDVAKMNTSEGEMAWTSFKIPMRKVFMPWSGARKGNETGIKCIHPCQRPIGLHEWLFKNYAKKGDKILDTHLGSMSIAIALHNMNVLDGMGLTLTGCELDEVYYNDGINRVREHLSKIRVQELDHYNFESTIANKQLSQ